MSEFKLDEGAVRAAAFTYGDCTDYDDLRAAIETYLRTAPLEARIPEPGCGGCVYLGKHYPAFHPTPCDFCSRQDLGDHYTPKAKEARDV